jgi:hypothetical protein
MDRFKAIRSKVDRAEKHLNELSELSEPFKEVSCELKLAEVSSDLSTFRLEFPTVPDGLGCIVGDFLTNVRASLDYTVWQIVEHEGTEEPSTSNMFPISRSEKSFRSQVKSNKLRGVPSKAQDKIEAMQPWKNATYQPLMLLNDLVNKDKHRTLNYCISVASDVGLEYFKNKKLVLKTFIGNDVLMNGASFGNVAFPTNLFQGQDISVIGRASAYLAFKDYGEENDEPVRVIYALREILDCVKHEVISELAEYFEN